MLFLLWFLNFGISWLNAWGVGRTWLESKRVGGWPLLINWCVAIMSASGFTWCYLVILGFLGMVTPYEDGTVLSPETADKVFELGYLAIIFPLLSSGVIITINSWRNFIRDRTVLGAVETTYNTVAMAHNIIDATSGVPKALNDFSVGDLDDDDGIAIFLIGLALFGGVLTTFKIIKATARKVAYEDSLRAYNSK